MKLLIIADDFTGALDTGVQLSKKNISTCVYVNFEEINDISHTKTQVVVVNGNLRHLSPNEAYEKTQEILKKLYTKDLYIYLKTDSVLRGNISSVFAAAIDFLNMPLYFIPAFPELKRITKNATAYVNGSLLENSVFAADPRTPTTTSDIHKIINRDNNLKIYDINIEETHSILNSETNFEPISKTVYLFDCESNEQLFEIANLVSIKNGYHLTAGCAGFASTFTEHITFEQNKTIFSKSDEAALFISGSANAVTFRQLAYAKEKNYPVFCLFNEFKKILYNDVSDSNLNIEDNDLSFNTLVENACEYLKENKSVIFATTTCKDELLDLNYLRKIGKNDEQIHNCIAQYTSNLVKSILDNSNITNIVIFGGDMVAATLNRLGVSEVTAAGEITTGVPLCLINSNGRTINLVTKSGGFGQPDLIPVIEDYLTGNTCSYCK